VSTLQDQARLVAERVARRMRRSDTAEAPSSVPAKGQNGSPVREELVAIRDGLHDLENKLERIESRLVESGRDSMAATRARVIDFVSPGPPVIKSSDIPRIRTAVEETPSRAVPTTSPWLAGISGQYQTIESNRQSPIGNWQSSHPSEERFGVEEAAVSELVEFFEKEKKCSLDPSGKPCDHCAMCSSRGF